MAGGSSSDRACPSESTVVGFLERRLSRAQRAELELHIDRCAGCRQLVIELSSGLQLRSIAAETHTTHPALAADRGELLAKGTVVGRFVVLDVLGAGGMGVVYLAYDPALDRKVALKLLRPIASDASDTRAQLLAEAQVMARISHANVIAVYDVGSYREQVFAAMELVDGTTLRRWMAERSHTWREVVEVFLPAGEGLAAAHAAGVVHRDFKPENVLLGHDGRVKVSDFGLAAEPSPGEGHVVGTPGYLPVEGLRPGNIDERGDQFSFCVALHEALHGRRPFAARGADELIAEVRRGPMPEPGSRVPRWLNHVVRRGLAFAPEDRYRSMRALLADLRRAVAVHRVRRLAVVVAGTMTVVIGATALVMDTRAAATQRPCAGAAEHLTGVWDRARRDAVQSAVVGTAVPGAAAAFERAAAVLDRYAADWVAIRTEACEATEVRREQSATLLELRMACLDRARIQLRALGDALASARADTVRDATAAAAALPALDACSDVEALRAIAAAPLRLAARSQIQTSAGPGDEPMAPAGVVGDDGGTLSTRPDFRLPFGCGEAWRIVGRTHGPARDQADFDLPGDESAAGFTVFGSAPGWVSRVIPENGQVDVAHGDGWFTSYQHMTDLSVSLHQYVGRGQAIGRVGNVNVKDSLGGPGPAHLHYEQLYQPGGATADLGHGHDVQRQALYLERETVLASEREAQVRTSTNNCFGGGAPGGATQYDVPSSTRVFSRSRATVEIMTRRSEDHALFERWYDRGWSGAAMPHTIVGQPAVAVFDGELHVLARKADGTIFDLRYSPFGGWQTSYLDGRVSGDPDVAVYAWNKNLHVAARGADGYLYHWWTGANGAWSRAVLIAKVAVVGTPALLSHYDALYIVARAVDGSLWSWEADRRGLWTAWQLRGVASDDPDIGVDPRSGRVNVVARGPDHRLYRWQSKDPDRVASHPSQGWSDPELVDAGRLVTGAPATILYHGVMHIFARGPDNAVDHWWGDRTWHREATGGAYSGSLDVFTFGDQLHTVGRGTRGDLSSVWYDPVSGLWNLENQHTAVTD